MKQRISRLQWDEISNKQKDEVWLVLGEIYSHSFTVLPNIGQMIEFLGEELSFIEFNYSPWQPKVLYKNEPFKGEELADVLWEACKFKLNEIQT